MDFDVEMEVEVSCGTSTAGSLTDHVGVGLRTNHIDTLSIFGTILLKIRYSAKLFLLHRHSPSMSPLY